MVYHQFRGDVMKTLVLTLVLFFPSLVFANDRILNINTLQDPTVRIGETVIVCWDVTAAEITNSAIVRSEGMIDDGAWNNIGVPIAGTCTSRWTLPSLGIGSHEIRVRMCNATECGAHSPLTFSVISLVPPAPGNLRLVPPPPIAVNLEQATELANSYAYVYRLSRLSPAELNYIAANYKGPLEKYSIIGYLDSIIVGIQ
jgi:hypothetical protein